MGEQFMKKCNWVIVLLGIILVLSLLMRYESSENTINVISKGEVEALRDSLILSKKEALAYRGSLDIEIDKVSKLIDSVMLIDSIKIIERKEVYEKISNSGIDGVYVGIKLYLDSIEIPKR